MSNYVFLNETVPVWSLMIILYPYITGIEAGSFLVYALANVFGNEQVKPVARLSLIISLCFLMFATIPLLAHLGHPERAFNVMWMPHFTSAIAGFGFIYNLYFAIASIEIWLLFRPEIIRRAQTSTGLKKKLYTLATLGVFDNSAERRTLDHKVSRFLSILGIPIVCVLVGYVGFIFGALKSNPWWSTSLMPVIFIISAMASGIAVCLLIYVVICKFKKYTIDMNCIHALGWFLFGFLIVDLSLELLQLLVLFYEADSHIEALSHLVTHKLMYSLIFGQILIFGFVPAVLLGITIFLKRIVREAVRFRLAVIAASCLLVQAFLMRYNVIAGGQIVSKSMRGYTEFHYEWLGREGLIAGAIVLSMPLVTLWVMSKILPITDDLKGSVSHDH